MSLRQDEEQPGGFAFKKGSTVLAHLYGEERLGTFSSFKTMQVTEAGQRAGYTDLNYGEGVNTPWAKTQGGTRVQLPVRDGMLYRIMLGTEKADASKQSHTQQRLLCLALVAKQSSFGAVITDADGQCMNNGRDFVFYDMPVEDHYCDLFADAEDGTTPLTMADFVWVFSSAQHTRNSSVLGNAFIRALDLRGVDKPDFSPRTLKKLANSSICDFAIPAVPTAVGQAKRAIPPRSAVRTAAARKNRLPTRKRRYDESDSEWDSEWDSEKWDSEWDS